MFRVDSCPPLKPYEVPLRNLRLGEDFKFPHGILTYYKSAEDEIDALIRNRAEYSDSNHIRLDTKVCPVKPQYDFKPLSSVTLSAVVKLFPAGDVYLKVATTFLYNVKTGDMLTAMPETMIYLVGRLNVEDKK